ncbi:adenosylcobalamin-dependent ribonucleoside-diphosphate reductase [Candidatus Daviesbacteria bacterium]|nr:adenosylcobalamin-dependent ribonucleoside-diphosphate reductase [Candidatus Daviesbacteria bacterium]
MKTIKSEKVNLQVAVKPVKKTNGKLSNGHLANGLFKNHPAFLDSILPEIGSEKTTLDGVRQKVFLDRYSLKDEEGKPTEDAPEQMWARVAAGIANEEKTPELRKHWAQKFYEAMQDFKFVPGGRILSGAGTGFEVTFFNCYVIPSPKDSRGGIMENIMHTVEIQARGGGVGINLSSLRPHGARVKKVNGTSSGPVNWASLYSVANHDVIQQGGSRRGALMLMLHDWHPDVVEFIHVKEDTSKIPGANLSVCVSDKFMEALENDGEWQTKFPDITDPEYDELWDGDIEKWESLGKPVKIYGTYKAKDIWDQICTAAWRSAEPGLHFLERSNKWSNTWYFEKLLSTNPCGEQPLGAWAVCNLGAMNLSAFVKNSGEFDFDKLDETVRVAMRFMDNVVDANYYFYKENEIRAKDIRRTGIGSMGLADALIKMKLKYGSEEAMPVIEKIYQTIRDAAYEISSDLAKEKGSFPKFSAKKYLQGHFIQDLPQFIQDKIEKQGIRNAVILTQAPTGTTSLLAGVSSGIEPVFDFKFIRRDRIGEHIIYHPLFQEWLDKNPEVTDRPDYFVGANDLTPLDHMKVQALIQKYTDSSISKTANAPAEYTVEQVKELYIQAYKMGCKGVTFFRDGSRSGVLYHEEKPSSVKATDGTVSAPEPQAPTAVHRPMILRGRTYRIQTPVGEGFITINRDENDQPFEVFINIGKGGTHTLADAEAMGRLVSLALRLARNNSQLDPTEVAQKIAAQLRYIGGASHIGFGKERVMSLADAIARALAEDLAINKKEPSVVEQIPLNITETPAESKTDDVVSGQQVLPINASADLCPECGQSTLVLEEGCSKCYSCGFSKC